MDWIHEAKNIGTSEGRACKEDIDFLIGRLERLSNSPNIVKLGANAAFAMACLSIRPNCKMWLLENDQERFHWELEALKNYGFNIERHRRMVGQVDRIAETYKGPKIDLLILDLSSSYNGIMAELKAWMPHLRSEGYVFVHDYDAHEAPELYPDIKRATMDFFGRKPSGRQGWSAVWRV